MCDHVFVKVIETPPGCEDFDFYVRALVCYRCIKCGVKYDDEEAGE